MKATPDEMKRIVEGAQRFLAPTDDPRDDELFDPSRPETPPTPAPEVVKPRPSKFVGGYDTSLGKETPRKNLG